MCNVNPPSHSEIQLLKNLTMKIHGQGHVCGQWWRSHMTLKIERSRSWSSQTHWSHLRLGVQLICSLFVLWQSDKLFLAEIQQVPYLTLKIQGQGHDKNWSKSNQVIYTSGPTTVPKMKEIQKWSHEEESAAGGSGVRTGTKHKVTPGILYCVDISTDLLVVYIFFVVS